MDQLESHVSVVTLSLTVQYQVATLRKFLRSASVCPPAGLSMPYICHSLWSILGSLHPDFCFVLFFNVYTVKFALRGMDLCALRYPQLCMCHSRATQSVLYFAEPPFCPCVSSVL